MVTVPCSEPWQDPTSQLESGCPLMCSSLPDLQLAGVQTSAFHPLGKQCPGSVPSGTPPLPAEGSREGSGTPSVIPANPTQGQEPGGTTQGKDLPILRHFWCPSISVLFPGPGGQQKAATSRRSYTGSSWRGSQENGTILLVAKWLPTLSCCPGSPCGICTP